MDHDLGDLCTDGYAAGATVLLMAKCKSVMGSMLNSHRRTKTQIISVSAGSHNITVIEYSEIRAHKHPRMTMPKLFGIKNVTTKVF
ncbi:MAG: hypothetical protein QM520_02525 [Gammaproteobacteria bacterium]|nr:hypothetical protein [Gammaproteobacteria bacterium]